MVETALPPGGGRPLSEMRRVVESRARRLRIRYQLARAAGSVAVLAVGVVVVASLTRGPAPPLVATGGGPGGSTTLPASPGPGREGWVGMSPSILSARYGAVSVWTGSEMLVWRGHGLTDDLCASTDGVMVCGDPAPTDGARYDPVSDSWTPMADSPMPDSGDDFLTDTEGVWTGSELVVWGGRDGTGAAYDPAADRWRSIASAPIERRRGFTLTWTGREVVAWGGFSAPRDLDAARPRDEDLPESGGAAYDPASDTWRLLAVDEAEPRAFHGAAWTGERLLLAGGNDAQGGGIPSAEAIDLSTSRVEVRSYSPVAGPVLAWVPTGSGLIGLGAESGGMFAVVYDSAADAWGVVDAPMEPVWVTTSMVWTGTELIVFGSPFEQNLDPNAPWAFGLDPAGGTWQMIPEPPLDPRGLATAVWTGEEVILWGGATSNGHTVTPVGDGARYTPAGLVPGR